MRPLLEPLARVVFTLRTLRARWRLSRSGDPAADPIRRALQAAGRAALVPGSRAELSEIEAVRRRLLATDEELTIVDYGAGTGEAALSDSEMAEGRSKQLTVADACAASKPRRWAVLLFHLVRELRPDTCVEMGTCVGISAAYQAKALQLNGGGRLVTLEGASPLARIATRTLSELGLDTVDVVQGRFQDTLGTVLRGHEPVDFVFVDGHHDDRATVHYFEQIRPHLSDGAVLVFDDIRWSPGMTRAWRTVADSRHTAVAVDLGALGLCVVRDTEEGS